MKAEDPEPLWLGRGPDRKALQLSIEMMDF